MVGGFLGVLGFEVLRTPFILVTDRSQAITPGLPDGRSHFPAWMAADSHSYREVAMKGSPKLNRGRDAAPSISENPCGRSPPGVSKPACLARHLCGQE